MNARQLTKLTLILGSFGATQSLHALSLDEYRQQVQNQSPYYSSLALQKDSSEKMKLETKLLFRPQFFAEAQRAEDGKTNFANLLSYDRLELSNYSVGIQQQFSFGLQAKLSYQSTDLKLVNSSTAAMGFDSFHANVPRLDLNLPLWANGFGRSLQAQETAGSKASEAQNQAVTAKLKVFNMETENLYWNLVASREALEIQKRALRQAEALMSYLQKQADMKLGEASSVLQARALVASRKLQFKQAENEELSARIKFNSARELSHADVADKLDALPMSKIQSFSVPEKRPADRADFKAHIAQAEAEFAAAVLKEESYKPSLDVYGSFALNGQGDSSSAAWDSLTNSARGTQLVGVKLLVPLDFKTTSELRKAARLKADSQVQIQKSQTIKQDEEWRVLTSQMVDAKESLKLSTELVEVQRKKLSVENDQLRRGRTTTYQVLMFEQDLSQAELAQVQISQKILALQSALELYQEEGR